MRRTSERERIARPEAGPRHPTREKGFVLVIVLVIIASLALLGLAANKNMLTDLGIAQNHGGNTKSFYAAEAAAEYAFNQFSVLLGQGTEPTANTNYAANVPATGCTINSAVVSAVSYPTPSTQRTITASTPRLGNFAGLTAWVTTHTIRASATDPGTGATSVVSLNAMKYMVPIFQFGIFYDNNLEMNPGANLNIPVNGWIHTNQNLYTSTSATETINSHITAAKQIYHTRAPNDTNAVGTGAIQIMGADGQLHTMDTGWSSATNGVGTWGGNVSNQVTTLNLPLPEAASDATSEYQGPEYILSNDKSLPGTMASLAAVTITATSSGVTVTDSANTALNTCYYNAGYKTSGGFLKVDSGCSSGANKKSVTTSSVYDYRQKATVYTTDIDVAGFQASAAGTALATGTNGGTAGVLYATSTVTGQSNAVRLTGGATLASDGNWVSNGSPIGLTVATDLPAYVQGNFNTAIATNGTTPPPAAIMSDALTVLSNQWSSSYTSTTRLSGRPVTEALTINANIMSGNTATDRTNGYGGGFENFIRFLEDWNNNGKGTQSFNFGGSLVCMWSSQKATAKWITPGTYYNAPNRQYTFGVFGNKWPPGTPKAVVVSRGSWSHR